MLGPERVRLYFSQTNLKLLHRPITAHIGLTEHIMLRARLPDLRLTVNMFQVQTGHVHRPPAIHRHPVMQAMPPQELLRVFQLLRILQLMCAGIRCELDERIMPGLDYLELQPYRCWVLYAVP